MSATDETAPAVVDERRQAGAMVGLLWLVFALIDLVLRLQVNNNADPSQWHAIDGGVYALGSLWSFAWWGAVAVGLGALVRRRRRLGSALVVATALVGGGLIGLSFGYRLYYYQSPSWQALRFAMAEPENTLRILSWSIKPWYLLIFGLIAALIGWPLGRAAGHVARTTYRAPRWVGPLLLALFGVNSVLSLLIAGFQDPLPVEANTAAAFAQFILAASTRERHLVAPVRPPLTLSAEAMAKPRPNVLLIVHESMRADAQFPLPQYSEAKVDARAISPFSSRLPEREAEGFFVFPQARSNASATEVSLPTILSGFDPGGQTDDYGRVHTPWSLGKATGAATWLFSAQTYSWSHFDEYFFDRSVDLEKTGLDLAPAYVNDIGVDDIIPVERALEQIGKLRASGQRWVGVVHFSGTHVPGFPGPGIAPDPTDGGRLRQASAYIDRCVARLVTGLDELGVADSTVIVSTSDHGEPFESTRKQRRLGDYYEEVARVPFWVRVPPPVAAQHPTWTSALKEWGPRNVQNLQVLPTIRDFLLLDDQPMLDRAMHGPSLVRSPGNAGNFAAGQSTCAFRTWWQEGIYVVRDQKKLMLCNERTSPELYDLATDPAEQHNLWNDPAARQEALDWAVPYIRSGPEREAACKRIGQNCVLP